MSRSSNGAKTRPGAPGTFADLVDELQRRLPELSQSNRAIAERVLNDPEGVAFMSISELDTDTWLAKL
ncbi:MAG: hypothetical protein GEV03_21435 [Streptosporangiales bacterium]|nr:hypothetical protein [Streptosporangiales bacterium]